VRIILELTRSSVSYLSYVILPRSIRKPEVGAFLWGFHWAEHFDLYRIRKLQISNATIGPEQLVIFLRFWT
jgi:hypothetical protein